MDWMSSLAHMGGYGGYVWPAYIVSAVVLVGVLAVSVMGAKARESELDQIQSLRRDRRRTEAETPT